MKGDVRRRGAICITINDFEEGIDEQRYRSNFYADQHSDGDGSGGSGNAASTNGGGGGGSYKMYNKKTTKFQCCPDLFGGKRRKQKFNRNYGSVNCSNFDGTNREG